MVGISATLDELIGGLMLADASGPKFLEDPGAPKLIKLYLEYLRGFQSITDSRISPRSPRTRPIHLG
ncbi:hypothetical protein V22_20170 [Calycomorphotria hydatis]|uniref:Uncharacterized protein n=1 Tax=Calycomorphotria hydatis TaxID=2528027 RepID=A0A517T8S5_9PLAN|nr:hypothetical protein V22_20170 [Calycomorphotria hydatis]